MMLAEVPTFFMKKLKFFICLVPAVASGQTFLATKVEVGSGAIVNNVAISSGGGVAQSGLANVVLDPNKKIDGRLNVQVVSGEVSVKTNSKSGEVKCAGIICIK